jgi:nitroreductase
MSTAPSEVNPELPEIAHEILDLMRRRRVVRRYEAGSLSRSQLEALIEAAYWAPSGGNRRPVKFAVIDRPAQIRRVMAASPGILGNPSAVIALCIDWSKSPHLAIDDPRTAHPTHVDIGAAMENVLLAAEALGLGAGPVMSFHRATVRRLLKVPDNWTPLVLITLGARSPAALREVEPAGSERLSRVVIWEQSETCETRGESMGHPEPIEELRIALLELMVYLVAAARGNVDEGSGYGPLRLLEGAQRVANLLDDAGLADEELRTFATEMTGQAMRITKNPDLTRQTADATLEMLTAKLEAPDVPAA